MTDMNNQQQQAMTPEPPPPYYESASGSDPNVPPLPHNPQQYGTKQGAYPQQPGSYPHQPGAYPQQPGPPPLLTAQPTMQGSYVAQTIIVGPGMVFGAYPVTMCCPGCQAQIVTQTNNRAGLLAWLICGGLVLIGCWAGCCLIPFCIAECQDIDHYCPNCKRMVGTYRRI